MVVNLITLQALRCCDSGTSTMLGHRITAIIAICNGGVQGPRSEVCVCMPVYMWYLCVHSIPPPLVPSDTTQGYKAKRADLGRSRVKKWSWMPFKNPARKVNKLCPFECYFCSPSSVTVSVMLRFCHFFMS